MPCDGKNINCDRRRELLAQLKCLISSMERRKPCEWDEPPCEPIVCCPAELPLCPSQYCGNALRACKSFNFRSSIMYRCECIKRNGLQDRCMMWECMGRPECMTKLYPVCGPGRAALLKLTDLGDAEVAFRKFYCADQAREAALSAYCRLVCDKSGQALPCNRDAPCIPYECSSCPARSSFNNSLCRPTPCSDLPQFCIPSLTYPDCCTLKSCDMCAPCDLQECSFPRSPPLLTCLPYYSPVCLPSVPCCN
ncbi:hypothetical protein DMN91_011794 [Ooceraea biroi]|uniref:Uncharacterized protein n=1 Tax=Ooceraea biroi TaxID=2015173 RepID=A0A026W666_OOCBI|nr:keratin-associated protein 10-7 [Ooceraea biroi]EZA51560.1 hypothetical protein X777_09770 [Ooceraea biroi]RLU16036.1 hypothetical protein DMN91_011794 [Ooceraea biroi]